MHQSQTTNRKFISITTAAMLIIYFNEVSFLVNRQLIFVYISSTTERTSGNLISLLLFFWPVKSTIFNCNACPHTDISYLHKFRFSASSLVMSSLLKSLFSKSIQHFMCLPLGLLPCIFITLRL